MLQYIHLQFKLTLEVLISNSVTSYLIITIQIIQNTFRLNNKLTNNLVCILKTTITILVRKTDKFRDFQFFVSQIRFRCFHFVFSRYFLFSCKTITTKHMLLFAVEYKAITHRVFIFVSIPDRTLRLVERTSALLYRTHTQKKGKMNLYKPNWQAYV